MTASFPPLLDRDASLGQLARLPDDLLIQSILPVLAPEDLCRLSAVSQYLLVFARNDSLWRKIYFGQRKQESTRLIFRGSWLLTFLFPEPDQDEACARHPLATGPTSVQGLSSEFLHAQWLRSNMYFGQFYPPPPMPPTPAIGSHRPVNAIIPIEDYQVLDNETFYRRYGYPNRPVMLQNSGVELWPAWEHWTLDSLLAKYGETVFRVSNLDGEEEPYFNLLFKDFVYYLRHNHDEDPLYLFDPLFADRVKEMETDYEVPKYFEQDYFSLLDEKDRPPFRWMLIGPQRTGAPWHTDPSGTSAWNTLLSGHKRWALYPPHIIPPGHDPASPRRHSSVQWYLDVYPQLSPEMRPIEIVQHPGQTIFVPSGWWHMVLNMDDTIAVTQNFVDDTNLMQVKYSMLSDEDESGQIHRWKVLAERLGVRRPDLIPALTFNPDQELEDLQAIGGYWLEPTAPGFLEHWRDKVSKAIFLATGTKEAAKITPVLTGHNVCFMTDVGFVKFFTPLDDGLTSFQAETRANIALGFFHLKKHKESLLVAPQMVGYGYLLEKHEVSTELPWRWPYIITESVHHSPLAQDPALAENDSIFEAGESMPETASGYRKLLTPLLDTIQEYHTTPIHPDKLPWTSSPRCSATFLETCLQNAALNHARWRIFPAHLLDLLPAYLPSRSKKVFDPKRGDAVGYLIHGDISPSNILGTLEVSACEEWALSEVQDRQVAFFKPTALIDFGDALLEADPLMDYVSVFVAVLNGRRDLGMCELLLDSWNRSFGHMNGSEHPVKPTISLARRCLWHILLWPSQGLALHLARCVPEIGEMKTWGQVEEALFGWWPTLTACSSE